MSVASPDNVLGPVDGASCRLKHFSQSHDQKHCRPEDHQFQNTRPLGTRDLLMKNRCKKRQTGREKNRFPASDQRDYEDSRDE